MPEMAPAAGDKMAPASAGMHPAAVTADIHIAAGNATSVHSTAATGMHSTAAAGMHSAAATVTATSTVTAAATVRSEYRSRDEQASGECRYERKFA
jgi:hypothetical protein